MKVIDPVCKMSIEESEAVATSSYKGKTYYFCSKPCKEDFDKNPGVYTEDKAESRKIVGSEKALSIPALCILRSGSPDLGPVPNVAWHWSRLLLLPY